MHKLFFNAYEIVCRYARGSDDRLAGISLRKKYLAFAGPEPLVKIAFDTRRINQATEYNPRRNLQTYHRSEAFIDSDSSEKIKTFFKLKTAVDGIKEDYLGDPNWLDSYCRVLSATLDRTLRVDQKDFDFFKPQIDYLDEMLYLRYRLKSAEISDMNEKQIRDVILTRDEKLFHNNIYANYDGHDRVKHTDMRNGDFNKQSAPTVVSVNDSLIEKLFGDVKASKQNKEVERSVTITIKDKLVDDIKKEG